ncbi:hypothetical protein IWQ62_002584 [Dispira parvispora]|uniref:RRN7-type domain-containing protein n=1 Tax=Dispira parvispora TaxID=1520584 RepID=A0A9W8E7B8_9FUNG|nr:hypothetical protein IWQ62_002584 [Dispira parvispora]
MPPKRKKKRSKAAITGNPCHVCGCQEYFRNVEGHLVCREGHQSMDFLNEENEANDGVTFTLLKRKTVKQRISRKKKLRSLSGKGAVFSMAKCIQFILQEGLQMLVDDIGLPEALVPVAREIWLLYCNLVGPEYNVSFEPFGRDWEEWNVRADQYDELLHGLTNPSDYETGAETENEEADGVGASKTNGGYGSSSNFTLGDLEHALGSTENDMSDLDRQLAFLDAATLGNDFSNEESAGLGLSDGAEDSEWSSGNDEESKPADSTRGPSKKGRGRPKKVLDSEDTFPKIRGNVPVTWKSDEKNSTKWYTISDPRFGKLRTFTAMIIPAILYLSCQWLRLPVFLHDIYRWIISDRFPLGRMQTLLPQKLGRQVLSEYSHLVSIRFHPRTAASLEGRVFQVAMLLQLNYQVEFPECNRALFVERFVQELSLPAVFYVEALSLMDAIHLNTALEHPTSGLPECTVAAVLVILIMMHYGLDGTPRLDPEHPDYTRLLPSYQQFINQFAWSTGYGDQPLPLDIAEAQEFCEQHMDDFVRTSFSFFSYMNSDGNSHYRATTFQYLYKVHNDTTLEKTTTTQPHSLPTVPHKINSSLDNLGTGSLASTTSSSSTPPRETELDKAYREYERYAASQASHSRPPVTNALEPEAWQVSHRPPHPNAVSSDSVEVKSGSTGHFPSGRFILYPTLETIKSGNNIKLPRPLAVVITRFSEMTGVRMPMILKQVRLFLSRLQEQAPLFAEIASKNDDNSAALKP